ncbi:MAG: MmgE/PrpD family protein [Proteobacteria bacterium]|nr:MmgE/PrpD family protein [Pseudomonadota bacterium]
MTAAPNLTERLCQRIVALGSNDLGAAAIAAAKRLILDGIAITVAGCRAEAAPAILAEHVREMGGSEHATAIGFGFKTSVVNAALINGASMHVLDYEPMWSPANHAVSTSLPTVLALAEILPLDGREMISALVKATEIQGWMRQASGLFESRGLSFHPPGMVGPLGAATAAGHLLGFDVGQMRNAIGLAASRCGSVLANAGTMTKSTHCGLAGSLGLDAALLARRGFTANVNVIEDPRGYAKAFFGPNADPALLERFGPPWRLVDPGYAVKMFPSQYGTHFVITAALEARRRIPDPKTIRAIEIRGPVMTYVDRPQPDTGLAGKFSFQYTASCALLDGAVRIDSFTDARRFAPDMVAMLDKVTVKQLPEMPAAFETMHVEVDVTLADGSVIKTRCNRPAGAWGEVIAPEVHLTKVRDCLARGLDGATAERVIALVDRFETLDSAEVRALIASVGDR